MYDHLNSGIRNGGRDGPGLNIGLVEPDLIRLVRGSTKRKFKYFDQKLFFSDFPEKFYKTQRNNKQKYGKLSHNKRKISENYQKNNN